MVLTVGTLRVRSIKNLFEKKKFSFMNNTHHMQLLRVNE